MANDRTVSSLSSQQLGEFRQHCRHAAALPTNHFAIANAVPYAVTKWAASEPAKLLATHPVTERCKALRTDA
jgi:hypothetical protein